MYALGKYVATDFEHIKSLTYLSKTTETIKLSGL